MTPNQAHVYRVMKDYAAPGSLWNAHEIRTALENEDPGTFRVNWTYDRVHAILVRLEKQGVVERLRNPSHADDWVIR